MMLCTELLSSRGAMGTAYDGPMGQTLVSTGRVYKLRFRGNVSDDLHASHRGEVVGSGPHVASH